MTSKDFLRVYVAPVPSFIKIEPVYPALRDNEICACSNQTVKSEKYCVWKLLEYAIKNTLNKDIEQFSFSKSESGKWECEKFEFSLSHSKGVVAVAISNKKVGVDIEREKEMMKGIENKMLTSVEKQEFSLLSKPLQNDYLLTKWTQKESVYKTGDGSIIIKNIPTDGAKTYKIEEKGSTYFLSVASFLECEAEIILGVSL